MMYKDPKTGIIIDTDSEKLPKVHKFVYYLLVSMGWLYAAIGVVVFFLMLLNNTIAAIIIGAVCGGIAWLFLFLGKKTKNKYYKARADVLDRMDRGEIKTFDEDSQHFDINSFCGIIINKIEVGTNLLGWVRGVDRNSGTTPVSARFTFTNKTGKEIKYITLGIRPYNAVGDPVECTVRGVSLYDCRCTGPFAAGVQYTQTLEDGWYNTNIETARIESAEIIYMDNNEETLSPEQIKIMPKNSTFSDNDSRVIRGDFAQGLMLIAGIIDVISIIGIFTMSSEVFGILTAISTVAFFIGLKMKH